MLLIGATTGFAEDFYSGVSKEDIFRHHSTNWIVTLDNNQMPIECGSEITVFDWSGRKFYIKYLAALNKDNKIVTRLIVHVYEISFPSKNSKDIITKGKKIYGAKIIKDDKDIIGGPRNLNDDFHGVLLEFHDFDFNEDKENIKMIVRGNYQLNYYILPDGLEAFIKILENDTYKRSEEEILDTCFDGLNKQELKINFRLENQA